MRLSGKSIVVTGASAGMGHAIVERFVKEGAPVSYTHLTLPTT